MSSWRLSMGQEWVQNPDPYRLHAWAQPRMTISDPQLLLYFAH